ncbi:hypothetical protein DFP73DRAFT_546341, partial [Morchella snyderi]
MYTASCILLLLLWSLFFPFPFPKPHALSNQRRPRKRPLPTGAGLHSVHSAAYLATACLFVPFVVREDRYIPLLFSFLRLPASTLFPHLLHFL